MHTHKPDLHSAGLCPMCVVYAPFSKIRKMACVSGKYLNMTTFKHISFTWFGMIESTFAISLKMPKFGFKDGFICPYRKLFNMIFFRSPTLLVPTLNIFEQNLVGSTNWWIMRWGISGLPNIVDTWWAHSNSPSQGQLSKECVFPTCSDDKIICNSCYSH